MEVDVRCTSGAYYAEEPRAFTWQGESITVVKINARSRTPDGRLFHVTGSDGHSYTLTYVEEPDAWQATCADAPLNLLDDPKM